ncbi:MAG TPA: hypothetical protein VFT82_04680 [Candidatus Paceibacterota bacterium]|nr:hypothetical protein [Candidatus Paceibacterota bacterium]
MKTFQKHLSSCGAIVEFYVPQKTQEAFSGMEVVEIDVDIGVLAMVSGEVARGHTSGTARARIAFALLGKPDGERRIFSGEVTWAVAAA